jgi:hypothetical protein
MQFPVRLRFRLFAYLFLLAAFSTFAFANGDRDRTQVGHDITVGPHEEIGEATCFGCSVRVRGHVTSDVTVFGGSVVVEDEGEISGDATVFGGGVRLDKGVKVAGDLTVFGGQIRRDPAASVGGDVTNFGGSFWLFLIFGLPLVILGAFIWLIVWLVRRLMEPSVPATA